jgi:hypothetical protein
MSDAPELIKHISTGLGMALELYLAVDASREARVSAAAGAPAGAPSGGGWAALLKQAGANLPHAESVLNELLGHDAANATPPAAPAAPTALDPTLEVRLLELGARLSFAITALQDRVRGLDVRLRAVLGEPPPTVESPKTGAAQMATFEAQHMGVLAEGIKVVDELEATLQALERKREGAP